MVGLELYPELRLILSILTCYRLARMIAVDDGLLFLFKRLRIWALDRAYYEAAMQGYNLQIDTIKERYFGKWHNLSEGLSCPYCAGVWLSLPILALVLWPTCYGDLFLILMAISGGQAFLWSLNERQNFIRN